MTGDYLAQLHLGVLLFNDADLVCGLEGAAQGPGPVVNPHNGTTGFFIDRNNYFPGIYGKTTIGEVVVCGTDGR
jgi:hypothetical protein